MLFPVVVKRTSTNEPTAPKLRPAVAFSTNGSLPANANRLSFGKAATGRLGFWMPPGEAAVSDGAWNVMSAGDESVHEPPGKYAVTEAVAVSIPHSVAAGVVATTVFDPVTVP